MIKNSKIKENVKIYEEIIQQVCELFIKIGIQDDPVKIYENFIFMYMNGFLSRNGVYVDSTPIECMALEYAGYIPLDITGIILLYGHGVCRHTTDFLAHIYQNLGYDNSQLFTYHPSLQIQVDNCSTKFLTNYEAQKYIDEATADLDLFSTEAFKLTKRFGNVSVYASYVPEDGTSLMNHTMNIVLDKNGLAHILDTRYHCVGERFDTLSIKLSYQGLTHIDFVQRDLSFYTYYDTDYFRGLKLLKNKTNMENDVSSSILYGKLCKENLGYYKDFCASNQRNYNRVADNFNRLVKKL